MSATTTETGGRPHRRGRQTFPPLIYTRRFALMLEPAMYERLGRVAQAEGVSMAVIVRDAIESELEAYDAEADQATLAGGRGEL